jgi:hypothetical protein
MHGIAATKDVLTRFWPPIEHAIRARAEARHQRIERLRHLAEQARQVNSIQSKSCGCALTRAVSRNRSTVDRISKNRSHQLGVNPDE